MAKSGPSAKSRCRRSVCQKRRTRVTQYFFYYYHTNRFAGIFISLRVCRVRRVHRIRRIRCVCRVRRAAAFAAFATSRRPESRYSAGAVGAAVVVVGAIKSPASMKGSYAKPGGAAWLAGGRHSTPKILPADRRIPSVSFVITCRKRHPELEPRPELEPVGTYQPSKRTNRFP